MDTMKLSALLVFAAACVVAATTNGTAAPVDALDSLDSRLARLPKDEAEQTTRWLVGGLLGASTLALAIAKELRREPKWRGVA
ncbi:uncharacterized protein LOC62_06G008085 [Vanrija pseudolonga]|uniref:Uncharacterized protein n=1 Tax=Vanrija pseudolonga TaxID=143232 RepID=A0AAF1BKF0_9TREE|nr:hypothetical protein LOC62_06G008085 [Vanrija pseudolonga]